MSAFDWRLARSFLAVLDAGSVMGAARALAMQQPTLSRHVAELEAQLGTALFERTGRGVVPTAAALAIAPAARQMQDGALQLEQAVSAGAQASQGTVRLAASQVAASWLLPPLLAQWQAERPQIQIELVVSNQLTNLLRREADIALRMVRPQQASLVARKLGEVGVGAYAHKRYLQRAGTPREPMQLLRHSLVGYDQDRSIEDGFARAGLPVLRQHFGLRTDDQVANAQLVAQGAGIGFLAHYHAQQLAGLQRVLPQLPIPPLPCWLVVHREIRGNALVRQVFDFLAQQVSAQLAAQPLDPPRPRKNPAASAPGRRRHQG